MPSGAAPSDREDPSNPGEAQTALAVDADPNVTPPPPSLAEDTTLPPPGLVEDATPPPLGLAGDTTLPPHGLADAPNDRASTAIAARYAFKAELGKGGLGRVFVAHDAQMERDVAIKELLPEFASLITSFGGPEAALHPLYQRFVREARVTGQLEHPSIVPVYEIGQREDGRFYYVMRIVGGRTLKAAITEATTLEQRLALLPHFRDMCNAIAYAHSRGVIHRDLKPANVMLGPGP